jgi:hypothetical protein
VDDVPLEKVLRRKVIDTIKEYGLYYESKPPTGMGASGLDLTVCLRGRFLGIEVKRSPKFDMTPRQAATAHAIQASGGMVMLVRRELDIDRLRELIEAEHGKDDIVRRAVRQSIMDEFTKYLLDTYTEQARAAQQAQLQAQLAKQQATLRHQMGQVASFQQARTQYFQQAAGAWTNLGGAQGLGNATLTVTNTPALIPTVVTNTAAVTSNPVFRQWVDPNPDA